MKASTFLVLLFLFGFRAGAANFYFSSSSGNDSRTSAEAQNPATPWRSLSKLNSFFASLQPGDSVLFKRGDTFYGTITVGRSGTVSSPIVLSAYGSGAKPIISGFTTLSNWVSKGGGIYECYNASLGAEVKMVTLNNEVQAMGRYPNQ